VLGARPALGMARCCSADFQSAEGRPMGCGGRAAMVAWWDNECCGDGMATLMFGNGSFANRLIVS
jgi:hypothetical protein